MNVRESKLTFNNDANSPLVTNGKKNTKNSNYNKSNTSIASLVNNNMNSSTSKSTTSKKSTSKKSNASNSLNGSNKTNTKNKNNAQIISTNSINSPSKNSTPVITNTNNSNSHLNKPKEETSNKVRKKSTTSKKLKKQKVKEQLDKSNNQLNNNQIDQQSNQVAESSNNFIEDSSLNLTMNSSSSSTNNQQSGWYSKEIRNMMHGFGDSPTPNQESVRLVEEIVHQQIICLLRLACDIAMQRQSKQICLEDFLFLLRKDKVKLCRLLKHFSLKDMRNRLPNEQWTTTENQSTSNLEETVSALDNIASLDAGCTIDFDEEELLNALILEQKTTQTATQTDSPLLTENLQSTTLNKATVFPQPTKRLKLCLDFLESIDQTGEFGYLQEDQFFDELKHNRMLRIEQITRFMSEKEYLNFYKARQASFANRQQPNKFRDWLFNVSFNQLDINQWEIKPNALAIEILQYFAYETVAILVDLALIVKQDKRSIDPVSKLISAKTHSDSFPLLNSNNLSLYSDSNMDYTSLENKQNQTNLFNPNTSFNNCLSMNNIYNQNIQINQQETQTTTKTILPSPFIFSSANTQTVECPFFSIKPQEIREVVRRYINCNPRGSLSSVLLFGIDHQWNQQLIARSKIMCL